MFFADILVVQLKRRRLRLVQHFYGFGDQLNTPRCNAFINHAFGAFAHRTFNTQNIFVACAVGKVKHCFVVGVDNHLHNPGAVAHIKKDNAAVVAPAIDPSAHLDGIADEFGGHCAAVMRAH